MQYRTLGKTGLTVSEIGLGCASFWGKKIFDTDEAIKLVHSAVDQGITFFDTGSSYSGGNAEPRLGQALAGLKNRQDLVIASKAGTRINNKGRLYKDFTPPGIRNSVESSLKNLGLSSLPILHLHGPQIEDLTDDLIESLERLRTEGKIRHLSVNSFDAPVIEYVASIPNFGAVMIDYNILRPERMPLIEKLAAKGLGIFAGMALAGGLYSNKIFYPKKFRDVWYLLRALKNHRADILRGMKFRFLEQSHNTDAGKIALGWVLNNPHIHCAVIGTTRQTHLIDNSAASGYALDATMLAAISEAQRSFAS
jgi:aryl-alcohol dehydrogenase-like predicted oxidoreductase